MTTTKQPMAEKALHTYETEGEIALIEFIEQNIIKPPPPPSWAKPNTRILSDHSTVTHNPDSYTFNWRNSDDQTNSTTRPAKLPVAQREPWAMDNLTYLTWKSITFKASAQATELIHQYSDQRNVSKLEDIQEPFNPTMSPDDTRMTVPQIQPAIAEAILNPHYSPLFVAKEADHMDNLATIASNQAILSLETGSWSTLIQQFAGVILSKNQAEQFTPAVKAFIQELNPKP